MISISRRKIMALSVIAASASFVSMPISAQTSSLNVAKKSEESPQRLLSSKKFTDLFKLANLFRG